MNLDWIKELIEQLPEISISRKNLIEIAGYPKWENVNSNLLAFYLDEKEEHGFGRLFFNSLIDLYESKVDETLERELFETDFIVEREASTDNGGRIDLILKEESYETDENEISNWSIIIENKLFAVLYNNLTDYWDSVNSEFKLGIVLSVNPVQIDKSLLKNGIHYENILHKELVEKVKQNLADYYLESDDRHLLFLKEYISNVNSYYQDKNKMKNLDTALNLFHSKNEDIEELKKVDMDLLKYISKSIFDIMEEIGFPPSTKKDSSKSKHFHVDSENTSIGKDIRENIEYAKKFRFWINIGKMRYNNSIEGVFELHGKGNTIYGDKLKVCLEKLQVYSDKVRIGTGGRSGAGYQHIFYFNLLIPDFSEAGFGVQLKNTLMKEIFTNEKKYIDSAVLELKKIIDNE